MFDGLGICGGGYLLFDARLASVFDSSGFSVDPPPRRLGTSEPAALE
jgi:hypothetical protein